ncbi:MAG: hypothetical protein R3A12_01565 [Ignavibacteria bacterium]
MLKNYFRNRWYETKDGYLFESRYKDHRKSQDIGILIDEDRRGDMILKDMSAFLKMVLIPKEQFDLIKMFLRFRRRSETRNLFYILNKNLLRPVNRA